MEGSVFRWAWVIAACASIAACGEETRGRSGGRGPRSGDASSVVRSDGDVSAGSDGGVHDAASDQDAAGGDGGSSAGDGGPGRDGGAHADAAGVPDSGMRDSGPRDAGQADAASPPDSGPPPGQVSIITSGCTADFGGDLIVSYNGSIAVGSLRGASLAASLQLDLQGQTGRIDLSSQHRIQTGLVINLVTWSTWTNIAQDPDAITGAIPDPITGTLIVRQYDPAHGRMNLELQNVTLQNVSDLSFCTLDGTVETTRLGR